MPPNSKVKPKPKPGHKPYLHFYVLPRSVAVRIFKFLPLESLLVCQRINKRFHALITCSKEIRPHLFQEPPDPSPPDKNTQVFMHPVFSRLSFSAYHLAKAIRIGEGLNSIFLVNSSVRGQFATSPALQEVVIRIISGGEWPFDVEVVANNEDGVTVWDVVKGITGFFDEPSDVSFGDHFGAEMCTLRGWDPKVIMQNHEFLNPDSSFPTLYIPDRECNKVFIADYAFNEFAAMRLVQRPVKWVEEDKRRAEWEVKKVHENLAGDDKIGIEDGKQAGDLEDVGEVLPDASSSVGSKTTKVDKNAMRQEEGEVAPNTSEEQAQEKLDDQVTLPFEAGEPGSLEVVISDNAHLYEKASRLQSRVKVSSVIEADQEESSGIVTIEGIAASPSTPDILEAIPSTTSSKLEINTNINPSCGARGTTSTQAPDPQATEPVDWEDAFS